MKRKKIITDAATRLLKQGEYALSENGGCWYRVKPVLGKKCLKCAIGLLIPDELYDRKFEGTTVDVLLRTHTKLRAYFERTYSVKPGKDYKFLRLMQDRLHDSRSRREKPLLTVAEALELMTDLE